MIGLSSTTYDLNGALLLKDLDLASVVDSGERRISKYKTLDSGVSIVDNGFVSSDSTYSLKIRGATKEDVSSIRYLISNYATITVTSLRGAWRAVISQYSYSSGDLTFTIELIKEV